ncbi:MAG: hypothetical protein WC389_03145 [Lutibacter sp.]
MTYSIILFDKDINYKSSNELLFVEYFLCFRVYISVVLYAKSLKNMIELSGFNNFRG